MRFRVRLALLFLLLSAFPLTLLALYSFTTSSRALRQAAEAEAQLMARELEQRVENVSHEIGESVRALARLPANYWLAADDARSGGGGNARLDSEVFAGIAQALPFIEGFKFVPKSGGSGGSGSRGETGGEASSARVRGAAGGSTAGERSTAGVRTDAGALSPEAARAFGVQQLQLAEQSVAIALRHLPMNLAEADRQKVEQELARVRLEIARNFAARRDPPSTPKPVPAPRPAAPTAAPAPVAAVPPVPTVPAVSATPATATTATTATTAASASSDVFCAVRDGDEVVGELHGRIKAKEILRSVLAQTHREQGEIPFALDADDKLYVASSADGDTLQKLPSVAALRSRGANPDGAHQEDDWVVIARQDPTSGLRFGIARPMSAAMRELRRATAFNFVAGFFLVGLATIGMIPLTGGMVKSVQRLEAGAARIAEGDLTTRVPVRSRDEFGRLAESFNHMAAQLAEHQERLLEQERLQKEREIERRLLEAENGRKSLELEEARNFQLSLLPRELPAHPGVELAVAMSTATEVGGDYYDFRRAGDGDLLLAIGDATGHGAAAGTMVTVVKSLFMAGADDLSPASFLRRSTGLVHGMGLSRMAMALTVARLSGRSLQLSSAGMPPALHFRAAAGEVDEISLPGMPLGTRPDYAYVEQRIDLAPGDALLFMSDGFPELPNSAGEPLGYERARERFRAVAQRPAEEIVAALEETAATWTAAANPSGAAPSDDVTFLVLRAT